MTHPPQKCIDSKKRANRRTLNVRASTGNFSTPSSPAALSYTDIARIYIHPRPEINFRSLERTDAIQEQNDLTVALKIRDKDSKTIIWESDFISHAGYAVGGFPKCRYDFLSAGVDTELQLLGNQYYINNFLEAQDWAQALHQQLNTNTITDEKPTLCDADTWECYLYSKAQAVRDWFQSTLHSYTQSEQKKYAKRLHEHFTHKHYENIKLRMRTDALDIKGPGFFYMEPLYMTYLIGENSHEVNTFYDQASQEIHPLYAEDQEYCGRMFQTAIGFSDDHISWKISRMPLIGDGREIKKKEAPKEFNDQFAKDKFNLIKIIHKSGWAAFEDGVVQDTEFYTKIPLLVPSENANFVLRAHKQQLQDFHGIITDCSTGLVKSMREMLQNRDYTAGIPWQTLKQKIRKELDNQHSNDETFQFNTNASPGPQHHRKLTPINTSLYTRLQQKKILLTEKKFEQLKELIWKINLTVLSCSLFDPYFFSQSSDIDINSPEDMYDKMVYLMFVVCVMGDQDENTSFFQRYHDSYNDVNKISVDFEFETIREQASAHLYYYFGYFTDTHIVSTRKARASMPMLDPESIEGAHETEQNEEEEIDDTGITVNADTANDAPIHVTGRKETVEFQNGTGSALIVANGESHTGPNLDWYEPFARFTLVYPMPTHANYDAPLSANTLVSVVNGRGHRVPTPIPMQSKVVTTHVTPMTGNNDRTCTIGPDNELICPDQNNPGDQFETETKRNQIGLQNKYIRYEKRPRKNASDRQYYQNSVLNPDINGWLFNQTPTEETYTVVVNKMLSDFQTKIELAWTLYNCMKNEDHENFMANSRRAMQHQRTVTRTLDHSTPLWVIESIPSMMENLSLPSLDSPWGGACVLLFLAAFTFCTVFSCMTPNLLLLQQTIMSMKLGRRDEQDNLQQIIAMQIKESMQTQDSKHQIQIERNVYKLCMDACMNFGVTVSKWARYTRRVLKNVPVDKIAMACVHIWQRAKPFLLESSKHPMEENRVQKTEQEDEINEELLQMYQGVSLDSDDDLDL